MCAVEDCTSSSFQFDENDKKDAATSSSTSQAPPTEIYNDANSQTNEQHIEPTGKYVIKFMTGDGDP